MIAFIITISDCISLDLSFQGSLAGKESACNAGDPRLILGWERSPGEGIGYPLLYSWAFLMAQMVKNLPVQPSHLLLSPSPPAPNPSQYQGPFQ